MLIRYSLDGMEHVLSGPKPIERIAVIRQTGGDRVKVDSIEFQSQEEVRDLLEKYDR